MSLAVFNGGNKAPGYGVSDVYPPNLLVGEERLDLAVLVAIRGSNPSEKLSLFIEGLEIHRYSPKATRKRITGKSLTIRRMNEYRPRLREIENAFDRIVRERSAIFVPLVKGP